MDCGPACLQMISAYHGKKYSLEYMRQISDLGRLGTNFDSLQAAAQEIGFETSPVFIPFSSQGEELPGLEEAPLPCIVYWNQKHFVVVHKMDEQYVYIADPADKKRKLSKEFFIKCWNQGEDEREKGYVLLFHPGENFHEQAKEERESRTEFSFRFLLNYVKPYRQLAIQVLLGLLLASLFQLIYPFLTQSIIDIGIKYKDFEFVILILLGQLAIFLGRTFIEVIRSWILLHVGTRLNISILTDFLGKLIRLPIRFFDSRLVGDIFQRVHEVNRIEVFLTGQSFRLLFSLFTLLTFGIVLYIYNVPIFLIFVFSALIYLSWVLLFLKRREKIDYQMFSQYSEQQSSLLEIVQGMPDIKLQNCEKKKQDEWEDIQLGLFKIQIRSLVIDQWQRTGATVINELKDIIITVIAAKAVIDDEISLGMMLAIQYIIGSLNGPLMGLVEFIQSIQNASISLDRFAEIFKKEDEEGPGLKEEISLGEDIQIKGISFSYDLRGEKVLENIEVNIPLGKQTAIVGISGSGKTTLLKILLKFYEVNRGEIRIGNHLLSEISHRYWRKHCGAVLQDGYIFSDTVANNIALADEVADMERIIAAAEIAHLHSFIQGLPMGYQTKIGEEGHGLSQGQRQRILIARAVYKNPDFLFFDEATNALDAKNELNIMKKMKDFFAGKTVITVAHRLSTVKDADQILVLDKGRIAEQGNHESLIAQRGLYFELVKNQLELGS